MAKNSMINAKNVAFDEAGAGLNMAGVDSRNMYARLEKLRSVKDQKEGGSKQLWENLSRWTTTPNAQHFVQAQPQQAALFNQFMKTGVKPAGLKDQTVAAATDWGLREAGRFQQHKPVDMMSGIIDTLAEVALNTVGNMIVPGMGTALSVAYGGIKGGVESGNLLGGLTGALKGYGAAGLGNGLANVGSNAGGWSTLLNHPGEFAANLGHNAADYVGNIGHNVAGFVTHPIDTIASGAGHLLDGGTVNNVNALSGPAYAARAGTTAGALAGAPGVARAAAALADNAGGSTGSGGVLDNVIRAGNVISPIVGGIVAGNAAKDAAKTQANAAANAIAEERRQYDLTRADLAPYRTAGTGALGKLSFDLGISGNPKAKGYNSLLNNFTLKDFTADPGYQFRLSEGQRGIENSGAARGMQLSGATLKALDRFNSDQASQEFGNAFNRDAANKNRIFNFLSGVAGTGQAATNTGVAMGAQTANSIGDLYTQIGNSQAAGQIGSMTALTGGFQNAFNNYNQQRLIDKLPNYNGVIP